MTCTIVRSWVMRGRYDGQWRIQDQESGGSKFLNEHIDKNIIKNNFDMFIH
jgi:hypothetical protein